MDSVSSKFERLTQSGIAEKTIKEERRDKEERGAGEKEKGEERGEEKGVQSDKKEKGKGEMGVKRDEER